MPAYRQPHAASPTAPRARTCQDPLHQAETESDSSTTLIGRGDSYWCAVYKFRPNRSDDSTSKLSFLQRSAIVSARAKAAEQSRDEPAEIDRRAPCCPTCKARMRCIAVRGLLVVFQINEVASTWSIGNLFAIDDRPQDELHIDPSGRVLQFPGGIGLLRNWSCITSRRSRTRESSVRSLTTSATEVMANRFLAVVHSAKKSLPSPQDVLAKHCLVVERLGVLVE